MVWVLPCNFDARHCHGGVSIRNTKTINIFNAPRRSSACYGSFGFGGGFWSMFGIGLGMSLFNGLFGGSNGLFGGGLFGGGQQAGGCNCGGNGYNSYNNYSNYNPFNPYSPYVPGQYSTIPAGTVTGDVEGRGTGTGDGSGNVNSTGDADGAGKDDKTGDVEETGKGNGTGDTDNAKEKKPAGTTGTGDNARYNLDDIKGELTPEEAKEARENFWKSIGANDGLVGLDKAWNNNRLRLGKDDAGNVYVIYKDENSTETAFKYDPDTKQYKLPNGTTFNKFSETCTDEVAKPKNIDEDKNKNVSQEWSEADAKVTTVEFDGRDKENGNCVKVGSTFGSWLLNHNDESIAQVTEGTEKIFAEYANGDDKISFDEFIAYLSGYEADAMRATADKAYGAGSKYHDTVDMDAYDMVKLVKIFNKYAVDGNIDKAGFEKLIKEMNKLKNSNGLV